MNGQSAPIFACAVVGMAGSFPCAPDLAAFWNNLVTGQDCIKRPNRQELLQAGLAPETVNDPRFVAACGAMEDVNKFDTGLFGLPLGEAQTIDAQHRLFLECAWQALESAGFFAHPRTKNVGVFGTCSPQRFQVESADPSDIVAADLGTLADFVATRVAYLLDLRGPALTVSTACSSSLVAVHLALCSLLTHECDLALAGGSAIRRPLLRGHMFEQGGIYSADGYCRPYDAQATGTVSGDGTGVVVLKRLADALRDGDPIHCVVLGSAINNDGREKAGYTAPSQSGQARVVRSALKMAGIAPEDVGYIEGHGTGTRLGDPIEFEAFREVWRDTGMKAQRCVLSSVKGNIGHLDSASGIAGFIKAVLAVEHGIIPGTANFQSVNPEIRLEGTPFHLSSESCEWEGPRRACIHSLGLGGTNVHVVIQQAPTIATHRPRTCILPVSARSEPAVTTYVKALARHLAERPDSVEGVASTLQSGRTSFGVRGAIISTPKSQITLPPIRASERPRLIFLCPGGGAQHLRMAQGLAATPGIGPWLSRADAKMKQTTGVGFWEAIESEELNQAPIAFAATVSVSAAVAFGIAEFGVTPDFVVGLSLGELTAAAISGCFSFETLIELAVTRGNLFQLTAPGTSALVNRGFELVQNLLERQENVGVAVVNGPDSCVISGASTSVRQVVDDLCEQGIEAKILPILGAAHSPLIESVRPSFERAVHAAHPCVGTVPGFSSLDGEPFGVRLADPQHWGRQLREPNRFDLCHRHFSAQDILIDLGPGRTFNTALHSAGVSVVNVMRHPGDEMADQDCLAVALARLWQRGAKVSWSAWPQQKQLAPAPIAPLERADLGNSAHGRRRDTANHGGLALWSMHWKPRSAATWEGQHKLCFVSARPETIVPFAAAIIRHRALGLVPAEEADVVVDLHALEEQPLETLSTLAGAWRQVVAVTRNGADVLGNERPDPLQAALGTFALVAGQEEPSRRRSVVDVAESLDVEELLREVLNDQGPRFRALRNGRVWEPAVSPLSQERRQKFQTGGVYLLIGGLGRFGRWVSRCASRCKPRCLAFVQRSAVVPDSSSPAACLIRELRAAGTDVHVFVGDAGNADFLSSVIRDLGKDYGTIDGVLHLAADLTSPSAFSPLSEVKPEELRGYMQNQLQSKLKVGLALKEVFTARSPGFVALFSSNASILGGPCLAFYAAANTALNALAHSQRAQGLPWTSICWDGWRLEGEQIQPTSLERYAISGEQALDLLERALGAGWGCLSACKGSLSERWEKWFERLGRDSCDQEQCPDEIARSRPEAPDRRDWSEAEKRVAETWEIILGEVVPDRHLDIFHLGGHSLMLLRIRTRLNAEFGVQVSLADLLRQRTVAGTAALVEAELQHSKPAAALAANDSPQDALSLLEEIERTER